MFLRTISPRILSQSLVSCVSAQKILFSTSVLARPAFLAKPLARGFGWKRDEMEKSLIKIPAFLAPEKAEAKKDFNRWLVVPPSVACQLCLGSVYAWSLFNQPLTRALGVVQPAADDWSLSHVLPVFSAVLAFHGISAALLGTWQEKVGARASLFAGAVCYGGGILVGAAGAHLHNLPLLILGYGILGGIGVGLAYVPPISNLVKWFPDRKGLATGMALAGFGGGALMTTPVAEFLLKNFSREPRLVGRVGEVEVLTDGGRRWAECAGEVREVVIAQSADLGAEGIYLVGTGSTGSAETLACLGVGYMAIVAAAALTVRTPPKDYSPPGWVPPPIVAGSLISSGAVQTSIAIRTPQFWCLWVQMVCIASSGFALASVAKTMMGDIFGPALPLVVTAGFASSFVMAMSASNLGGRIIWATVSDYIGRKQMFAIFTMVSIPLYLVMPYCCMTISSSPSILPLAVFYGSSVLAFSFFAGNFSVTPAYEADLFGTKYLGSIHGRMMTANATAALIGPQAIALLRTSSETTAIKDLADKVSPADFLNAYGAPLTELDVLIRAKTVDIKSLLEILPSDTVDPTPFLYNSTLYSIVGLMAVASVANLSIKPVDEKYKEKL